MFGFHPLEAELGSLQAAGRLSTVCVAGRGRLRCSVAEKPLSVSREGPSPDRNILPPTSGRPKRYSTPRLMRIVEPALHRAPLWVPLIASPSSLVNATKGTTLLYTFERATLMDPSAPCCFTTFKITC
jgi:hypothetical protein